MGDHCISINFDYLLMRLGDHCILIGLCSLSNEKGMGSHCVLMGFNYFRMRMGESFDSKRRFLITFDSNIVLITFFSGEWANTAF